MMDLRSRRLAWTWALLPIVVVAILIRVLLLPTAGLPDDLDQFVLWVHGIATNGLAHAYDQDITFPPIMAGIWASSRRSSPPSEP